MHRRTGGNPFFVRELTRLDQLRGESGQAAGAVDIVDSVRDVIERRLARLSQPCARLLVDRRDGRTRRRPWVLRKVVEGEADVSALLEEAIEGADPEPRRRWAPLQLTTCSARSSWPACHRRPGARPTCPWRGPWSPGAGKGGPSTPPSWPHSSPPRPLPATGRRRRTHSATPARPPASQPSGWPSTMRPRSSNRRLTALDTTGPAPATRLELLLEVAAAQHVAGRPAEAAATYREAWALARNLADPIGQARAALGLHGVGTKTGPSAERDAQAAILESAVAAVGTLDPALLCDLRAALARTLYHSLEAGPDGPGPNDRRPEPRRRPRRGRRRRADRCLARPT